MTGVQTCALPISAEAAKWNILAKAGGRADAELDDAQSKLDPPILKEGLARAATFKPIAFSN